MAGSRWGWRPLVRFSATGCVTCRCHLRVAGLQSFQLKLMLLALDGELETVRLLAWDRLPLGLEGLDCLLQLVPCFRTEAEPHQGARAQSHGVDEERLRWL